MLSNRMNFKHEEMCGKVQHGWGVSGCNDQPSHSRLCEEVGTQPALPIVMVGKMWPRSIKVNQAKAEHMTGWNRFDFQVRLSIFFKA